MAPKKEKVIKNNLESEPRQQILDAALKLFAQKGYAATTVREIVDTVGITAPSLYYYFGNKEGLYMELMQTHCAQIDSVLESHLHTSASARNRLKNLVDKIFLHVIEDKDFFRLILPYTMDRLRARLIVILFPIMSSFTQRFERLLKKASHQKNFNRATRDI